MKAILLLLLLLLAGTCFAADITGIVMADPIIEGQNVAGTVMVADSVPGLSIKVSLLDAMTGQELDYAIEQSSPEIAFDFGPRPAGNYRVSAEVQGQCVSCSKSRVFSVNKPSSPPIPELDFALLPLIAFSVLAAIALSRRSKKQFN